MPLVHRRIFYAKAGMAGQVISALKDGEKAFRQQGLRVKSRVLADWNSGRTDRVVWEWETPSLEATDREIGNIMNTPAGKKTFDAWFKKLTGLIHYADVENWMVK